ncbi:MAG: DNA polymerase III subunit gamma/tau [Chloroflexi bacterium]|nr:DNA polymerase III subunit gamma/tau [Chloroflexota bacterium]
MTQALYRKWRPMAWDEVVGQEHVTLTLRNALKSSRVAHAYLFTGPRGTGKTTTARLVAKAVNCLAPDVAGRPDNTCPHCLAVNEGRFLDLIEIDAASNTSVDDVRDLRDKINFSPNQGRYKVYVVDEVHMLSNAAFNALLKTLEEPPAHAIFILATTEVHKVPATVTSRCQRFDFRRISVSEIIARLELIAADEGVKVEPAALEVVARQATGSMRDAVSLLDQLVASPDETITLERAQAVLGTAVGQAVQDLVETLAAGDTGAGLTLINKTVDDGADPRQFARQTVDYLRGLLLVRMGNASLVDAAKDVREVMARQANLFEAGRLLKFIRAFNNAALDQRGGWQPQLPLELAFVECSLPEAQPAPPAPVVAHAAPSSPSRPGAAAKPPKKADAPAPPLTTAKADSTDRPVQARASSGGESSALTLSEVRNKWDQIKAAARKQHPTVQGLINSCRPVKVEGDLITLSTNEIVREKLHQAATQPKVEAALQEALGRPCRFKCVLSPGGEADTPAEDEIPEDGVVATAVRDLGGKLANR